MKKWLILILIIVVLIVIAVYFPSAWSIIKTVIAAVWKWFAALPWYAQALWAFGLAFMVDPDGTIRTIHTVTEAVGDAVGAAVGGLASAASKGLGGLFAVGVLVYMGYNAYQDYRKRKQSEVTLGEPESSGVEPAPSAEVAL